MDPELRARMDDIRCTRRLRCMIRLLVLLASVSGISTEAYRGPVWYPIWDAINYCRVEWIPLGANVYGCANRYVYLDVEERADLCEWLASSIRNATA